MSFTNFETKEINCKVVYFGSRGAGKTANMRAIYESTSAELKSGMLELANDPRSTRFFDFLPISLGRVQDFHLKIHLFTLPVNSLYDSVYKVILKGIDGFVFVADSRVEAMADNVEALVRARRLLTEYGYNVADMPRVFQYNKRDLNDIMPIEVLRQELNPSLSPDHDAVATDSRGTLETLESMAKLVVGRLAN